MGRADFVQCQGCHGSGGYKDVILDDGTGPWEACGYCQGHGRTTKIMNAWVMRWARDSRWCPSDEAIGLHHQAMDEEYLTIR